MKKTLIAMTAVLVMASCGAPSEQAANDSTLVVDSLAVGDSSQVANDSVLATDSTVSQIPAVESTDNESLNPAKEDQGGSAQHGQPIK
jgi:uncharacterized protein YcfL